MSQPHSPASESSPPKGTPVRMLLTQQLRESITDGTFKPGDRMIERDLCERWNVSRASVREALRQLEAEGLIEIISHRGPLVRSLSYDEMIELRELQLSLERLVARRFALYGSEAAMDLLDARINELEQSFVSRDQHVVKTAKAAYFEAFTAGAQSETLREYVRQVNARLAFLWASSLMVPGRSAESITNMRMLLTMIRNRNSDAAEAAITIHHELAKAAGMRGWEAFQASQQASRVLRKPTKALKP